MSLNHLTHVADGYNAHLNIGADLVDCKELIVDGVHIPNASTSSYNANIALTGATNLFDPQGTKMFRINNTYTLFGFFICDVQAVNRVTMTFDVAPGTASSLANRTISLVSNKNTAGAKAFVSSIDSNVTATRIAISSNTFDQSVAVPANQIGTTFYYQFIYVSDA